jgi:phosphatidate phosphatase LPIN
MAPTIVTDEEAATTLCCANGMLDVLLEHPLCLKNNASNSISRRTALTPSITNSCSTRGTTVAPIVGNAFDLILVRCSQTGNTTCSEPTFSFASSTWNASNTSVPPGFRVVLEIEPSNNNSSYTTPSSQGTRFQSVQFSVGEDLNIRLPDNHDDHNSTVTKMTIHERDGQRKDTKALNMLADFLQYGRNHGRYLLLDETDEVVAVADVHVNLWSDQDRLAVVDIDGTITKSNVRGVVDTVLTNSYKYCHDGVCGLLSQMEGVRVIYLTCRPMSLANHTRKFLSSVRQTEHALPEGAFIGFAGSMTQMLFMELVYKTAHKFKTAALERHVMRPFHDLGVKAVFCAAFGNTLMDMEAYHDAGMELNRVYLVDKKSRIYCLDRNHQHEHKMTPNRSDYYLLAKGTAFDGYKDQKLLLHLLEKLTRTDPLLQRN